VLIDGQQERASEPMHFGFGPAPSRGLDHRHGFGELIEPASAALMASKIFASSAFSAAKRSASAIR